MKLSNSLPARLGYVVYSCIAGAILFSLLAGVYGLVQNFLDGGLNDSAARRAGDGASHFGLGVGGAIGALLGAFILQDTAGKGSQETPEQASQSRTSNFGLVWVLALILAGICLYLAFGQDK